MGGQHSSAKRYRKYLIRLKDLEEELEDNNTMAPSPPSRQRFAHLATEFEKLKRDDPKGVPTKVALLAENLMKNRYSNVLPFDRNRVLLKGRENDYINASYVSVRFNVMFS